jgi:hypothetical protein
MSEQNDDPFPEFDKLRNNNMEKGAFAVKKSLGLTETERDLAKLAERTFLSLWSYPNIWRNQEWSGGNGGDGKEVCDLLVVFENHIIIFSDKNVEFKPHPEPNVAWRRWYKKAVQKSAEQIYGAERWVKEHPSRLFIDSACTQPFPIPLPPADRIKVHRIVVAHGISEACKQHFNGGSGSLMIVPSIIGDAHLNSEPPLSSFVIGQVDPRRGYVHVFDDITLPILLTTLDTIKDFVWYLERKEHFIESGRLASAPGEEELLAHYLQSADDKWHGFPEPKESYGIDSISLVEGEWLLFQNSIEYKTQQAANRISYAWDRLIEILNEHILADNQHPSADQGIENNEKNVRWLAREPRIHRRVLATALWELYQRDGTNPHEVRVTSPLKPGYPHYVFLLLSHNPKYTEEEYRHVRQQMLRDYCVITGIKFPNAQQIIGIGANKNEKSGYSYDLLTIDASKWSEEEQLYAKQIQEETGFLKNTNVYHIRTEMYPVQVEPKITKLKPKGKERNKPCPCGSGRKYKHCHGKNN